MTKFSLRKALGALTFCSLFWPPVTFRGKFSRCTPSGRTGSNDIGLKTVALPRAESIAVQTFLDIIML
jgi:hypothetical protein